MDVVLAKFIWRRPLQKWPNYKLVSERQKSNDTFFSIAPHFCSFFIRLSGNKLDQMSHLLFALCSRQYWLFNIFSKKKKKEKVIFLGKSLGTAKTGKSLRKALRLESRSIIVVLFQCYFFQLLLSIHYKFAVLSSRKLQFSETSSHGSNGSPHFLIGIMVGLVSTLLILAMLVVILIKVHTRRHPQYESTHTGVNVGNTPASSDTRNNTVSLQKINSHPGGAFGSLSPSGSDDPDLIPLRSSTSSRIGTLFVQKYSVMKFKSK